MNVTVLVAGRNGQIARALVEAQANTKLHVVALGRPDLDILSGASIRAAFDLIRPGIVINAAAYTSVDQAETETEAAYALNASAAGRLAAEAARKSVPIIHLSTDYVFDGSKDTPYQETDPVRPLGVYGASKLAGEQALAAASRDHLILRTAWVYSPFGRNFVKTMLALAGRQDEVRVVDDQTGNPTSAGDIAESALSICSDILSGRRALERGVFHLTAPGAASWAEFAEAIFRQSAAEGGPSARVVHIPTSARPSPAPRPQNSRLDCTRIRAAYGIRLPEWQDSLNTCLQRLIRTKAWIQ